MKKNPSSIEKRNREKRKKNLFTNKRIQKKERKLLKKCENKVEFAVRNIEKENYSSGLRKSSEKGT